MMLFSDKEMKRLLQKKKPGRKKKVKRVLIWKEAFKVLQAGGYICFRKRVNSEEIYLKLCRNDGNGVRILHFNTYNALIRKNRLICSLKDNRIYMNPQWRKRRKDKGTPKNTFLK